jgi:hypothetical protein
LESAQTRKFPSFAAGLWLLLSLSAGPAISTELNLGGYDKTFFVVFDPPRYESPGFVPFPQRMMGLVDNRLRLNFQARFVESVSFSLSYSISSRIQDPSLFEGQLFPAGIELDRYRALDFRRQLYPQENSTQGSLGVFHNLDRACLSFRAGGADIFIGRQAIAWGSARVINPTDVIAPFTFEELDTEDRVGVDAVRVRVPTGFMGEFDAGWVFGRNFNLSRSAVFLRGKFYSGKTDISLLFLDFQNNLLAGVDIARAFGGAGFWVEGAYVLVKALAPNFEGAKKNYLRLTIGTDYSFRDGTYAFVEYHYSGAGASQPQNYLQAIAKPGVSEGAVYLMGRHYLAVGFSHQITPLLTLTTQALVNLGDPSCFIAPLLEYNLAENIYLSGGAFIGAGRGPRLLAQPFYPTPVFQSEFGGYPDIFFSSLRVYF